jgi:hypothetical protein
MAYGIGLVLFENSRQVLWNTLYIAIYCAPKAFSPKATYIYFIYQGNDVSLHLCYNYNYNRRLLMCAEHLLLQGKTHRK